MFLQLQTYMQPFIYEHWCKFTVHATDVTMALFPDRPLKNVAHASAGNPVGFNQSADDFKTKVFPKSCIRKLKNAAFKVGRHVRI